MSNTKLLLTLVIVAVAAVCVEAHYGEIEFYQLKKGKLSVNFTNFGARVVSLKVPDKFGHTTDIVLGYDSIDDYQRDKHSLGAIVGKVANKDGVKFDFSDAIWKVTKYEKSKKTPFITFQYDNLKNEQESHEKQIIVTATYLININNSLQLTLRAETKHKPITLLNLAQNIYWNLGGHKSFENILRDHLHILASNYRQLDDNLVPTGKVHSIEHNPYDFQNFHPIHTKIQKLKNGYEVAYLLDHHKSHDKVALAATVRDKKSGREVEVWTDQKVLHFSTGEGIRIVQGKYGVSYQQNAGLVLSAQGNAHSRSVDSFPSLVITKGKPYKQTTIFKFYTNK